MAANESKLNALSVEKNPHNHTFSPEVTPAIEENLRSEKFAIEFENVSRLYQLHHEPNLTLQDRVLNLFKKRNSYEDFFALKDVSFKLEKGRTLGIIGKNGAGKSTLLKLATRILEPTNGAIRVNGLVSAMLELGTGFHPELTARENIYLNGAFYGFNRQQMAERYERIVEFSELGKFIDTPVKHFSSGMYMRLGFAIAITVSPDILIIDEVLAVGDAAFGRKCHLAIEELKSQSKAMMLVSHAAGEISRFCDEVIYLANGQIVAWGNPGEVLDEYMMDSMGPSYLSFSAARNNATSGSYETSPITTTPTDFKSVHDNLEINKPSISLLSVKPVIDPTHYYQLSNGVLHRHLNEQWQFNLNHHQFEEEVRALPGYYLAVLNPQKAPVTLKVSGYKHSANSFDQLGGAFRVLQFGQFVIDAQQFSIIQLEDGSVFDTTLLNLTANYPIAVELVEYHPLERLGPVANSTTNRVQPGYRRYFPFCDIRYDNQCYFQIFNPNEQVTDISLSLYRDWAGPVYEIKTFQCGPYSQLKVDLKEELMGGEGEHYKGERFYGGVEIVADAQISIERYSLQTTSPLYHLSY